MTDATPPTHAPLFSARITPNDSLSNRGFLIVMLVMGGVSFAAGAMFVAKGAWPVVGFLGLDVLLVWLAFRAYARRTKAYEEIVVTAEALTIRRVSAAGVAREVTVNPYWARLTRHVVQDEGLVRLDVVSHGRRHRVARDLSPPERKTFADALDEALALARAAPSAEEEAR